MLLRPGFKVLFAGVLVSLMSPLPVALASEGRDCSEPTGTFWSAISPVGCTSPVGFCTDGALSGDIEGSYHFVMTTMTPVPGEEAQGHFTFTGQSTITTEDGQLFGQDHGELWLSGDFAFMTTVGVYGGNECFDGAEGTLVATGNINMVSGRTEGTYTSEICHAQNCFHRADEVSTALGVRH